MTTKVEDLTDEQLNVLVATCVMEWECTPTNWWILSDESMPYSAIHRPYDNTPIWSPSTDIACAFQVDKPEWEWSCIELHHISSLAVKIWTDRGYIGWIATVVLPLDPDNKTAAYCRGRCIAACYACGITEVD